MTSYRKNNLPHSSVKNLSSYSIYNQIYVPKYAKGGNFIGKMFGFVGKKVGQGLKWAGKKLSGSTGKQVTEGAAERTAKDATQAGTTAAKGAANDATQAGTTAAEGAAERAAKEATQGVVAAGKEAAKKESIFRKGWNWYKKSWSNPWLNTGRLMYLNADLRSSDTKLYGLPDVAILHTLFPSEGIDNMLHKYLGSGSSEQVQAEAGDPAEEIDINNKQLSEDQQWLNEFLSTYE